MARVACTKTLLPAAFATAGAAVSTTAADTVNDNSVVLTGNEVVIALNTDTGAAHNVTINSVGDQEGRTGDIATDSVPACVGTTPGMKVYQRFPLNGWLQTDGTLHLQADNAAIKFVVIQLQ